MKLSNKILIWGFVSVIIVSLIFILFLTINSTDEKKYQVGAGINIGSKWSSEFSARNDWSEYESFDILIEDELNFNRLELTGPWDVELIHGDEIAVSLITSDGNRENVKFKQDAGSLNAYYEADASNIDDWSDYDIVKLVVVTPELRQINLDGAGKISYSGFKSDELYAVINGAVDLTGNDFSLNSLTVEINGMGNVDFVDGVVRDLTIRSTLIGRIAISVEDADIRGNIDGMGEVTLYGSVDENDLDISGIVDFNIR